MFTGAGNSTREPQAQKALPPPWPVVGPFGEANPWAGPRQALGIAGT